eukprot:123926-Pyramimonas_sp.AAC.1
MRTPPPPQQANAGAPMMAPGYGNAGYPTGHPQQPNAGAPMMAPGYVNSGYPTGHPQQANAGAAPGYGNGGHAMTAPLMSTEMQPMAPGMMAAPNIPVTMDRLLEGEGVMLKQLTSECCRCFCCQPNIHWTLTPYVDTMPDVHAHG